MNKKRFRLLVEILVLSLLLCTGVAGSESGMPSLFHNDEAWYKDAMAPLRIKDGRYHVPADFFGMFEDIQVSYRQSGGQKGDNVLFVHTNGTYASILFRDKTAVVNGELQENIGVFRENGYTYVDGEWMAAIFDLTCTYAQDEDGRTVLRITDADTADSVSKTLEELMELYRDVETTEERPYTPPAPTEDVCRLYIVTGDNYENPTFPAAEEIIENSGLGCTLFLHPDSAEEKYWLWGMTGQGGICADSVAEADAVNDKLEALCCRRLEYVLPATKDTDRDALRQAGYLVIEPDFVVDYRTDPDAVYAALAAYSTEHSQVIVQVSGDGCSQRMIALLCELIEEDAVVCSKQ